MSFTFPALNPFTFRWVLTDADGQPVNDATAVTATLYSGRSISIPDIDPGTPVTDFDNVTLEYVTDSDGIYEADIPGTFDPEIGGDFVLVVDAVRSFQVLGHWEIPAIVEERAA
jgi:hypothetical protein